MNDIFDELVSSNYWNGKLPKVEFARKSYTNRIFGYVGNRLVKAVSYTHLTLPTICSV